jgi:hypothetical protein
MTGKLRKLWNKVKPGVRTLGNIANRAVNFVNNNSEIISRIPGVGPAIRNATDAINVTRNVGGRLRPLLK